MRVDSGGFRGGGDPGGDGDGVDEMRGRDLTTSPSPKGEGSKMGEGSSGEMPVWVQVVVGLIAIGLAVWFGLAMLGG